MAENLKAALFALDIAIQTEKDGRDFYLRAAESTQDERGRALFQRLADDELAHKEMLEKRKESLVQSGKWLPFEESVGVSVPSTSIFAEPLGEGELNARTTDLSALRVAYLLERDAVEFYSRAAQQTDDPEGKKMYLALVEMEKMHEETLKAEYQWLSEQFKLTMGFAPF